MAAILGSLSNNDGDGQENVSFKVCSCWFKLYRAYSISLYSSDVGEFFLSWILKDCIRVQEKKLKKRVVVWCSRPQFHVVVVKLRQQNVQNSVMHVQNCCFANLTLLLFCRPRCRRCRRCLSSLLMYHWKQWNSGHVGEPKNPLGLGLDSFLLT